VVASLSLADGRTAFKSGEPVTLVMSFSGLAGHVSHEFDRVFGEPRILDSLIPVNATERLTFRRRAYQNPNRACGAAQPEWKRRVRLREACTLDLEESAIRIHFVDL